jgi:hypothetical protein
MPVSNGYLSSTHVISCWTITIDFAADILLLTIRYWSMDYRKQCLSPIGLSENRLSDFQSEETYRTNRYQVKYFGKVPIL